MRDQIRPESPKYHGYYALSALDQIVFSFTRGDALRFASRFTLAFIFRAFGALFRLCAKPLATSS
jgi:hypothetical protein